MYMYYIYLARSEVNDDGRVLIGDRVVGVTERVWPFPEAWLLGAEVEKRSHADMTRRL